MLETLLFNKVNVGETIVHSDPVRGFKGKKIEPQPHHEVYFPGRGFEPGTGNVCANGGFFAFIPDNMTVTREKA